MRFLQRVDGLSLRNRMRSSDLQGELRAELLPWCQKEPTVVIWAPEQDFFPLEVFQAPPADMLSSAFF